MSVIRLTKREGAKWVRHRTWAGETALHGGYCQGYLCDAPTTAGTASYTDPKVRNPISGDLCMECGPKWCDVNSLEYI